MGYLREIVLEIQAATTRPAYLPPDRPPSARGPRASLRDSIERSGPSGALVVEFKRVSPGSESPQLPPRSPVEFVRATASAPVAGYSCIATGPRFFGSPNDVAELAASTDRPVLFKDFVVSERQLDAAVWAGARAVLLIARLEPAGLLATPLDELSRAARARGLEVLLEFHDRSELRLAGNVAADMYGVNVRDLDTLRMEPGVAEATIRAAGQLRPLLGLSGVSTPADAQRFWELGVDGILVGSAVARAVDPGAFLRS
ncbi:MAG: hypothetical protein ACREDE_11070, partial [Thermoplasmata archaeon]